MNILRIIINSSHDPYLNLSLDEAILRCSDESRSPSSLRLWVNRPSVIIGCSQTIDKAVHLEYCIEHNIEILRRFTGGGAVYHDLGNLNWSFVSWTSELQFRGISLVYKYFGSLICKALNGAGFSTYFAPTNRIEIEGCKISGMAGYFKRHAVLMHGTLLISTQLEPLNRICKPPSGSPPVTNLQAHDSNTSVESITESIMIGLSKEGISLSVDQIRDHEMKLAKDLIENKYAKLSWNIGK